MKRYWIITMLLCIVVGVVRATDTDTHSSLAIEDTIQADNKYTFSDFFDALEIPTMFGAVVTPNGIEGAGFNTCFRLGWRQSKRYGAFAFLSFDTHSAKYDNLYLNGGRNICTGTVWYYEVGFAAGYRVPLVKDIQSFYDHPYEVPVNFYCALQPGATMTEVPIVSVYNDIEHPEETLYQTKMQMTAVPSMRLYAGVEWWVLSRMSLFAEVSYIQHLMPTILEQAAIEKQEIKHPSGPITCGIGLSIFF